MGHDSPYHVSTTYWPSTGGFYAGDQTHINMKYGQEFLKPIAQLKASIDGKQASELITKNAGISQLTQSLTAQTAYARRLAAAADPVNLSHLQQIQLIRRVTGEPVDYFALENMFTTINVDMLQAREPIQGTFAVGDYLAPLEETDYIEAKYDEISYNLEKIPILIYTPIEDIMRTVINPQEINIRTAAWALKKRRNRYALDALQAGTPTNTNVGVIDALAPGDFHSTNKTASNIAGVINDFLEANDSLLTHIAMNNKDFAKYTENTWTNTGPTNMQFNRLIGAGVSPFPGVSGLTAVIDPLVPEGEAYLVDKINAARLAEGPKIQRRYYDENRDAEAVKTLDFNQFLIVRPDQAKVTREFAQQISFV